jgi:integrase
MMLAAVPSAPCAQPRQRGTVRPIPKWNGDAMQISKVMHDCSRRLEADGYSPATVNTYELTWRQYLADLITRQALTDDIRHFTVETVEAFDLLLAESGITSTTRYYRLGHLSSLADYAVRTRDGRGRFLLESNPLAHIRRPQKIRPAQKVFHLAEAQAVMAVAVPPNERLARAVWIESALRVSELCRLSVGDVALGANGQAVVSATVKGRGRRLERIEIELSDSATVQIQDALLARGLPRADAPLLVNQAGERYQRSALYQAVVRWGRAAGITRSRISPHMVRNLWAVISRQQNIDTLTRSRLLNHSDTKTLSAYDSTTAGETAKAREIVREALLSGIGERTDSPVNAQNSMIEYLKSGGRLTT